MLGLRPGYQAGMKCVQSSSLHGGDVYACVCICVCASPSHQQQRITIGRHMAA